MWQVSIYGRDITSHTASEDRVQARGADAAYGGFVRSPGAGAGSGTAPVQTACKAQRRARREPRVLPWESAFHAYL